jgi:hypothetical protein
VINIVVQVATVLLFLLELSFISILAMTFSEIDGGSEVTCADSDTFLCFGDIVLVAESENEVQAFRLFRISRSKAKEQMTPLSYVYGHYLQQSDADSCAYDAVLPDEMKLRVRDLVSQERLPVIIPRQEIQTVLQAGVVSFSLTASFVDEIETILDQMHDEQIDEESDEDEAEGSAPEADSEALRQHLRRLKEQTRVDYIGCINLRRSSRSRNRTEHHYPDFYFQDPH